MKRALRPGPGVPTLFVSFWRKSGRPPGLSRGFCIGDKTGTYLTNRFVSGHGFSRAAAGRGWREGGRPPGLSRAFALGTKLEPISQIALYQGTASAVPQPGRQRAWALAPDGACLTGAWAKAPTFSASCWARLKSCPDTNRKNL